ncbi:MAG: DsbA family oxidoreductase [Sporichthyaceae bacterium]
MIEAVEYTDPFCSYAWGTEPRYRRLHWQYDGHFAWRRVFVGILSPGWPAARFNVSAAELRVLYRDYLEGVSELTGAPRPVPVHHVMDGSDTASRIARAAGRQGPDLAERFLRRMAERLFVDGVATDTLERAVETGAGLDGFDSARLAADLLDPAERAGYLADWEEARRPNDYVCSLEDKRQGRGAAQEQDGRWRYGLPCLVLSGPGGTATIAGWREWPQWEAALETVAPGSTATARPLPTPEQAFDRWPSLTPLEFAELCGPDAVPPPGVVRHVWPGGSIWRTEAEQRSWS